jgi:hypothetical protein
MISHSKKKYPGMKQGVGLKTLVSSDKPTPFICLEKNGGILHQIAYQMHGPIAQRGIEL